MEERERGLSRGGRVRSSSGGGGGNGGAVGGDGGWEAESSRGHSSHRERTGDDETAEARREARQAKEERLAEIEELSLEKFERDDTQK
jgi:hypothetical protein